MLRWRSGRSRPPPVSSCSSLPVRRTMSRGSRTRVRAAASSRASGWPSSIRHSSATASALSSVTSKSGATARARSTKSRTDSLARTCSRSAPGRSGRPRGPSGICRSSYSRNATRLVSTQAEPGQPVQQLDQDVGRAGLGHQLFQVVQDQHDPLVRELLGQQLQQVLAGPLGLGAQRLDDGREQLALVGHRGQGHQRGPRAHRVRRPGRIGLPALGPLSPLTPHGPHGQLGRRPAQLIGHREREPRLADAARPEDGHDPHVRVGQEVEDLPDLGPAADQLAARAAQPLPRPARAGWHAGLP